MSWHQYELRLDGRRAGILFDNRFAAGIPGTKLPELGWFGVYCRLDPGAAYWHPTETDTLDSIEQDLIRLCDLIGQGNIVYLRRVDTRGIREYYFYFSTDVDLGSVLPRLKVLHPGYRLEYECRSDPAWEQYKAWLRER